MQYASNLKTLELNSLLRLVLQLFFYIEKAIEICCLKEFLFSGNR